MSDNPRPIKRLKLDPNDPPPSSLSTLTASPSTPKADRTAIPSDSSSPAAGPSTPRPKLKPLPPTVLLTSLPGLLAHPPNHKSYILSLSISLNALRKCLSSTALSPEVECRAWLGLAEVGMRLVAAGLSVDDDHPWARGIEVEVDKALSKGGIIAQKHPFLWPFKHHFSLLQAQFSHWQHRTKFSRTQIRNLISSLQASDPSYIVYSAHLAAITLYTTPEPAHTPPTISPSSGTTTPPEAASALSPGYNKSSQDIHAALSAVQTLESLSHQQGHAHVTLLSQILRLRILVAAGMWTDVPGVLQQAETALGLSYEPSTTPKPGVSTPNAAFNGKSKERAHNEESTFITFDDPFEAAMAVHLLIMSVAYYTHAGVAVQASPRLSHLHALLDSNVLDKFTEGIVHIAFPAGPPLIVQVTHPRILFLLTFLVTSVAKRDAVGRKPKRKVFAAEGLAVWDKELSSELFLPVWSSLGDVEEIEQRLARIKADLLCELIAVSTMRSEFNEAEKHLAHLIAHTRTYGIFPLFSARITLHHAHLAHALCRPTRAMQCYDVAAKLAEDGSFVQVSARAGKVLLKMALRLKSAEGEEEEELEEEQVMSVIKSCKGMGGTLEAVGHILQACLSSEILKSKQHLKSALTFASQSQDNYLRALILALVASQYFYTAGDHAQQMLQTCEQLAAGLGAPPSKPAKADKPQRSDFQSSSEENVVMGNVPLGLWVGERFLELYKRAGKTARAQKQAAANTQFMQAAEAIQLRGATLTAES